MRLHYHLPTGFVGGGERHLEYLLRYLRPPYAAVEPEVLVTYQSAGIEAFVQGLGVRSAMADSALELARLCAGFEPDVVQFFGSRMMYDALGLLDRAPRVIEVVHNLQHYEGDTFSYPKDRTDFLVCVSPHARLFAWSAAPGVPAIVIPNGVDDDRFRPDPDARSARPVIGFAGRLTPEKDIDALIELAVDLQVPLELVGRDFAGYGRRVEPLVRVLPETPSPEAFYRRWWAFVSASPREAFGMAIAEAMACGCPPVLLDCGGITAYLRHGKDALIAADRATWRRNTGDVLAGRVALDMRRARRFPASVMASEYARAYGMDLSRLSPPVRRSPRPVDVSAARTFRPVRNRPGVDGGALAVTPHGWYGVVRALAGLCDHHADPEHALVAIDRYRPRLVVLGCYQEEWLPVCRYARQRGALVAATWHASYILNEFHEINRRWMAQMLDAFRAGQIDFLATPHEGLARHWTHFGYPTAWLPNIIDEDLVPQPKLDGIHIGVFGSGQNWKNMECQIAAAGMIPGATIHAHALRAPEIVERLGIRVQTEPEALDDADYHALVGGMTVNLCISQSEVYSYLTAESFLMETPVLTGCITPLVRQAAGPDPAVALCQTPLFEDPMAIAEALMRLIEAKDRIGPALRRHMLAVNRAYRAQCERVLSGWLAPRH